MLACVGASEVCARVSMRGASEVRVLACVGASEVRGREGARCVTQLAHDVVQFPPSCKRRRRQTSCCSRRRRRHSCLCTFASSAHPPFSLSLSLSLASGGMVLGPLLVSLGCDPLATAATSAFAVLVTATSGLAQVSREGSASVDCVCSFVRYTLLLLFGGIKLPSWRPLGRFSLLQAGFGCRCCLELTHTSRRRRRHRHAPTYPNSHLARMSALPSRANFR